MLYNAIIRDPSRYPAPDIIGRLLVSDWNKVPASWTVTFRGVTLDKKETRLESLMCGPQEPLQILKTEAFIQSRQRIPEPSPLPFRSSSSVRVRFLNGEFLDIPIPHYSHSSMTVADLKIRIAEEVGGVLNDKLQFIHGGKRLEDERTLGAYGIGPNDSTVYADFRLRAGGFSTVDLAGSQIKGKGVPAQYHWEGYSIGLNLYGDCPNPNCISNTIRPGRPKDVVVHAKYGLVRMTREKNKFKCPACDLCNQLFTPKNFVVSFGRAQFRFKKSGLGQPVKTVLLESLGLDDEFKTFDEKSGTVDYDMIEIITVGRDSSPYFCIKCNIPCKAPTDPSDEAEVVLKCGHSYHCKCVPACEADCAVCKADLFDGVHDLPWTMPGGDGGNENGGRQRKVKEIKQDELGSLEISEAETKRVNLKLDWIKELRNL